MPRKKKRQVEADVPVEDALDATEAAASELDLDSIDLNDAIELIATLEAERKAADEARLRALADYRNFQRRATDNELKALDRGAMNIVRSMLPVLDQFEMALGADPEQMTVEQLLLGVSLVRDEFMKQLAARGLSLIEPQPGDEFDPNCHEAMMRQPADGIAPNHVVMVMQNGYMLGEVVVRPAKVSVAPEAEGEAPAIDPDDDEIVVDEAPDTEDA